MSRIKAAKLYDSLTEVEDRFVQEAGTQKSNRIRAPHRRLALIAVIAIALLLSGFAAYQAGVFDPWLQEPSTSPVETVRSAIENQVEKEYTVAVRIDEIAEDPEATIRAKNMYKGIDFAKENGWSDAYLEKHLIVVRAAYYVEYDHTKTFQEDGEIEQFFILLRDNETQEWEIWDNTTNDAPFN